MHACTTSFCVSSSLPFQGSFDIYLLFVFSPPPPHILSVQYIPSVQFTRSPPSHIPIYPNILDHEDISLTIMATPLTINFTGLTLLLLLLLTTSPYGTKAMMLLTTSLLVMKLKNGLKETAMLCAL